VQQLQKSLQAFLDDHRIHANQDPEWLEATGAKPDVGWAATIASLPHSCWPEFISNTELAHYRVHFDELR
jgi:hypothetical protein